MKLYTKDMLYINEKCSKLIFEAKNNLEDFKLSVSKKMTVCIITKLQQIIQEIENKSFNEIFLDDELITHAFHKISGGDIEQEYFIMKQIFGNDICKFNMIFVAIELKNSIKLNSNIYSALNKMSYSLDFIINYIKDIDILTLLKIESDSIKTNQFIRFMYSMKSNISDFYLNSKLADMIAVNDIFELSFDSKIFKDFYDILIKYKDVSYLDYYSDNFNIQKFYEQASSFYKLDIIYSSLLKFSSEPLGDELNKLFCESCLILYILKVLDMSKSCLYKSISKKRHLILEEISKIISIVR